MSGGWPSQAGKRAGLVRAGAPLSWGDYTARRFPPFNLWKGYLDGLGAAGPIFSLKQKGRISRSVAQTIRQPRDRKIRAAAGAFSNCGLCVKPH
jgi:hypothetical protein